jgi:UDP:flavonoid glycosyltransferase YjiC (YdhE family)
MVNFAATGAMTVIQDFYFKPKMEQIYREKLGDPNLPSVNQILSNASLILSNSHFSLSPPKPFLPEIVEVGGMHCRPAQPLPKDLEEFVSSSGEDGFIYFSMGSAIQAHTMPEKLRKTLVNVFGKLKQKVLWKWETETMEDLPKNVKLGKWLPQQDILGHPKIRMFITHGGYGSTTEAVYHVCPLLGIPMLGDQSLNMQKSENSGFALTIDYNDLTEETFLAFINRLLNEPSFRQKAKALSKVFQDQPDKPLDRAVYWTEYVLRHKGAVHMRSAARELNFFQYHSIDVIGSYLAILFMILYIIYAIGKFVFRKLCGASTPNKSNERTRTGKKTN